MGLSSILSAGGSKAAGAAQGAQAAANGAHSVGNSMTNAQALHSSDIDGQNRDADRAIINDAKERAKSAQSDAQASLKSSRGELSSTAAP